MFDYCVSRNKKGNGNNKESRVQCSVVEKCYPVIVLLALINGMDLPCSCVTVLLVLRYSKMLPCYCVTACYSVTLLLSY